MSDRLKIGERINEVRKEVEYIKKEKRVESYTVVEHDQVTAELRKSMIKHGIITVIREIQGDLTQTGKQTKNKKPITAYVAKFEIDFCCIDDINDKIVVIVPGIGEDYGDKGPGKATSYAVKMAMLKTFNIETGDSDESRIESEPNPITDDQKSNIDLLKKTANPDEEKLNEYMVSAFGTKTVEELTESNGNEIIRMLQAKIKKNLNKDKAENAQNI